MTSNQLAQQQYFSDWHDDFVNHIGGILGVIEVMENYPSATDEDKKGIDQIQKPLHGRDSVV